MTYDRLLARSLKIGAWSLFVFMFIGYLTEPRPLVAIGALIMLFFAMVLTMA